MDVRTYEEGEVVFREGDPGDRFYIIMMGHVKVRRLHYVIAYILLLPRLSTLILTMNKYIYLCLRQYQSNYVLIE